MYHYLILNIIKLYLLKITSELVSLVFLLFF
nr:MAG TPA: hypothetical protein [Inoviridae sp.]